MEGIQWIFFDLGGTLMDEHLQEAAIARILHKEKPQFSVAEIEKRMEQAADACRPIVKTVIRTLADTPEEADSLTKKAIYRPELERLYPGIPNLLSSLGGRYRLGIIANQSPGAEQRLEVHGIRAHFSAFFLSSERGHAKPDRRLFTLALEETGCEARHAVMVGDRLDNDIFPARALGLHTVRVLQGLNRRQKPRLLSETPEATISTIRELDRLFP